MTPVRLGAAAATSAAPSPDRVGGSRFPLRRAGRAPAARHRDGARHGRRAGRPPAHPAAGRRHRVGGAGERGGARRQGPPHRRGGATGRRGDRSHRAGRERPRRPGRHRGARDGARARAARPRLAAGGGPGLPRQAAAAGRRAGLPGVGVHRARHVRRRGRGAAGRRPDGRADRHVGTGDAPPLPAGHGRRARAAELLRRPPRGAHGADAHREVGVRPRAHRPLVRRVARPDRGGRLQRHRRQRRLPRGAAPLPQRGRRHRPGPGRHVPRGGADVVRHPDRPRAGARGCDDHPFRGPPDRGQRPPRGAGRDQPADG